MQYLSLRKILTESTDSTDSIDPTEYTESSESTDSADSTYQHKRRIRVNFRCSSEGPTMTSELSSEMSPTLSPLEVKSELLLL